MKRLMLRCKKCKGLRLHMPADWGKCFCRTCRTWRDNPLKVAWIASRGKEKKS